MIKITTRVVAVILTGWFTGSVAYAAEAPLTTLKDRFSYSLGLQIGKDLSQMKDKLDIKSFMRGVQDHLGGKKPLLTAEEIVKVKQAFQTSMREEIQKKNQVIAGKNREEGKAFLAANKKRKGITTTASGLQYEVINSGRGPKPEATSVVKVHYQGTLLDGTEFDSSYKRKEPVSFGLNRVISGWQEGLQLMPVGAKYRLFIPSDLAYGKRGAPPKIAADATLIFEVELLEIMPATKK